MTAPEERPWTARMVADYYAVQPRTVVGWVKSGRLPVLRRQPRKDGHGPYLFSQADVVAVEHQGREVDPRDVEAVIEAELRRERMERRGA